MPAPKFVPGAITPPTPVTSLRDPSHMDSMHVVAEVADKIHEQEPDAAPFTVLTSKISGKEEIENYIFYTLSQQSMPDVVEVTVDADTTLTLQTNHGLRIKQYDLLRNARTDEIVRVTTPGASTTTCIRAWGTAKVTMVAGDKLYRIGNAFPDGTTSGTLKSIAPASSVDYLQLIRDPFGSTGRQIATKFYGGDDWNNLVRQMSTEHSKNIEKAMLFSSANIDTSGSYPATTMGGMFDFPQTNVWNLNGYEPNSRQILEFLEEAMKWGPSGRLFGSARKLCVASARWLTVFNTLAEKNIQVMNLADAYGLTIRKWVSIHGTMIIVNSPIFDSYRPDAALIVDLRALKRKYMRGRDTKLLKDRQANDADSRIWEYMSDVGLEKTEEYAHAKMIGLGGEL
jgi:hypothetical protein